MKGGGRGERENQAVRKEGAHVPPARRELAYGHFERRGAEKRRCVRKMPSPSIPGAAISSAGWASAAAAEDGAQTMRRGAEADLAELVEEVAREKTAPIVEAGVEESLDELVDARHHCRERKTQRQPAVVEGG